MIPQKETNTFVASIDNLETSKFTIEATGKAFKVLSEGLYKNKIKSMIRELACNSMDSHIQAGFPDKPFYVEIPTTKTPILVIEDEGLGLSHENVMELYRTYFASTKTKTNDATGMLGLGSKSPFAYTSSFTIYSTYNKVRSMYKAYITDEFLPNITRMTTEIVTDAPNGVRIEIPIEENDIWNVRKEALNVLTYFDVCPIIRNDTELQSSLASDRDAFHSNYKFSDGSILAKKGYYDDSNLYAIQGNVYYPVDVDQIDVVHRNRLIKETKIILKFNIGDVDVVASRDELSYDKRTKYNINQKLSAIFDFIYSEIARDVNSQPTYMDACRHFYIDGCFNNIRYSQITNDATWNGLQVKRNAPFQVNYKYVGENKNYETSFMKGTGSSIELFDRHVFYYNDGVTSGQARLRILAEHDKNRTCKHVMIEQHGNNYTQVNKFLTACNLTTKDIKLVSSLPKQVVVREKRTNPEIFYNRTEMSESEILDDRDYDDVKIPLIFVDKIDRRSNTFKVNDHEINYAEFYREFTKHKMKVPTLARKKDTKKIKNMDAFDTSLGYVIDYLWDGTQKKVSIESNYRIREKYLLSLKVDGVPETFYTESKKVEVSYEFYNMVSRITSAFPLLDDDALKESLNSLFLKFPVLRHVEAPYHQDDDFERDVKDYINLVLKSQEKPE